MGKRENIRLNKAPPKINDGTKENEYQTLINNNEIIP